MRQIQAPSAASSAEPEQVAAFLNAYAGGRVLKFRSDPGYSHGSMEQTKTDRLWPITAIFARAGMALSRSTLAQWVGACGVQLQPLVGALKQELLSHTVLHADETPVAILKPGNGKTHRAYLWSYCTTSIADVRAVVFDFADSRAGHLARQNLPCRRVDKG